MEVLNYLREYEDLCKKYKLTIGGCGCCGSPFIELKNNEDKSYYIQDIELEDNKLKFDIKQDFYSNADGTHFYKENVDLEWLESFINNNFKEV